MDNKFNITYNDKQIYNLRVAGYKGIANDPDGLETLFFIRERIEFLKTHNKNYNKKQAAAIEEINDIIECLYKGV